jgi:hypothetical protein
MPLVRFLESISGPEYSYGQSQVVNLDQSSADYFILIGVAELSEGDVTEQELQLATGGYEFTGGFTDRAVGQAGADDLGSNVSYTTAMANEGRWMRFGIDIAKHNANDDPYWTNPTPPADDNGIGLFGGQYLPPATTKLFNFLDTSHSAAKDTGDLLYTAANGSLDFTECQPGDLALVRFDFNVIPQVANSTLEVGLIWAARDASDVVTFEFALTASPIFYGEGSVGEVTLNRPLISAYFASYEDTNARALPAIRCDNPILIQPLTMLATLQR